MGFSSFLCVACKHPLLSETRSPVNGWMEFGVVVSPDLRVALGVYDGYGQLIGTDEYFFKTLDDAMGILDYGRWSADEADFDASVFHQDCWMALRRPGYIGPSESDTDQGLNPGAHLFRSPLDKAQGRAPRVRLHMREIQERVAHFWPRSAPLVLVCDKVKYSYSDVAPYEANEARRQSNVVITDRVYKDPYSDLEYEDCRWEQDTTASRMHVQRRR